MFDHLGFGVTNLAESKAFYLQALQPLGVEVAMEGPYGVGLGREMNVGGNHFIGADAGFDGVHYWDN